jgi:hypothetical protein
VLAQTAYDAGRAVGTIVAAGLVAWVIVFAWGAWTADADRIAAGRRHATHWRTLSVAGVLWLVGTIGSL